MEFVSSSMTSEKETNTNRENSHEKRNKMSGLILHYLGYCGKPILESELNLDNATYTEENLEEERKAFIDLVEKFISSDSSEMKLRDTVLEAARSQTWTCKNFRQSLKKLREMAMSKSGQLLQEEIIPRLNNLRQIVEKSIGKSGTMEERQLADVEKLQQELKLKLLILTNPDLVRSEYSPEDIVQAQVIAQVLRKQGQWTEENLAECVGELEESINSILAKK